DPKWTESRSRFFSCTSCVCEREKCEAKNCFERLEVDRTWHRILCSHVLRTFAGPSNSFSDKGSYQRGDCCSQNDFFIEWRFGNLDGAIEARTATGPRRCFHFALLRQRGSSRSLACRGGRDVEGSRSGDLGNALSRIWRQHRSGATNAHWTSRR